MTVPALPDAPSPALTGLLELLDLERIEVDIFRGRSPQENRQRVFGGQVAGQALVAAGRTVPGGRRVHSLHGYFLRAGDVSVPIVYEVDRIRDGRSFTTRRVVAIQHGRAIFNLSASFQVDEAGVEHTSAPPDVPGPDGLATFLEHTEKLGLHNETWVQRPRPIDMRYVESEATPRAGAPRQQVWLRTDGPLPDDPLLHV